MYSTCTVQVCTCSPLCKYTVSTYDCIVLSFLSPYLLETNLESYHTKPLSSNATGFAVATLGRSRPFNHSMRRARISTISNTRRMSKEVVEASMARPPSQVLLYCRCTYSYRPTMYFSCTFVHATMDRAMPAHSHIFLTILPATAGICRVS